MPVQVRHSGERRFRRDCSRRLARGAYRGGICHADFEAGISRGSRDSPTKTAGWGRIPRETASHRLGHKCITGDVEAKRDGGAVD